MQANNNSNESKKYIVNSDKKAFQINLFTISHVFGYLFDRTVVSMNVEEKLIYFRSVESRMIRLPLTTTLTGVYSSPFIMNLRNCLAIVSPIS